MLLKKVIIENIRSHKYFKFEPQSNGVTAISGENGVGKSTIVNSFAWSLFGTRPSGLKNKNLIREGVDPKTETVKVTSYISTGNRDYKISRQIMSAEGAVQCKVWSRAVDTTDEWEFETGPSVTSAESYLRQTLNMDEKGFLSSVFVQQKQVDQILNSSPAERGKIIEKLIGVSAVTEATKLANEESRALQKAANIIQTGSIEEEKEKVEKQKELVLDVSNEIKELTIDTEKTKENLSNLKSIYEIEKTLQEEKNNLETELSTITNSNKILKEQLQSQLELVKNTQLKKGRKVLLEIVEEDYNSIKELIKEEEILKSELEKRKFYLDSLFETKHNKKKLESEYNKTTSKIDELTKELENRKYSIIQIKTEVSNNKELLELINKGEANCPTCGQQITSLDDEVHIKKQDELLDSLKVLNEEGKILISELNLLKKQKEEKEILLSIATEQDSNLKEYKSIDSSISKTKNKIATLQKEHDILNEKLVSARVDENNRQMLELAKSQIKNTEKLIKENSKNISNLENKIKNSKAITKKEYKELEKNFNQTNELFVKNQNQLENLKNKLNFEKEKGRLYLQEYNRCKKANQEHKALIKQLNIVNISSKHLKAFREERIKASIPALSKIASEILSKFTDGKFNELILTEKFEAFVITENQNKRAVSLLSGGEESAVAMALRLAIALFLADGEQNLLILDEILVSMSEDRAQLMLETISSLTKAQIIFIAHNITIHSFADKVVNL